MYHFYFCGDEGVFCYACIEGLSIYRHTCRRLILAPGTISWYNDLIIRVFIIVAVVEKGIGRIEIRAMGGSGIL